MAVVFGTSSKGKPTVIYRNFEYVKERDNHCGTTSWRCQKYQSMQCKARLLTSGNRIVSNRGRRRRGRAATYSPAVFPVETWNQHAAGCNGIARSTNSVERWHHGLQSLFQCHHPTVWTFMSGIQQDICKSPVCKKVSRTERSSEHMATLKCLYIFVRLRTCPMHRHLLTLREQSLVIIQYAVMFMNI